MNCNQCGELGAVRTLVMDMATASVSPIDLCHACLADSELLCRCGHPPHAAQCPNPAEAR